MTIHLLSPRETSDQPAARAHDGATIHVHALGESVIHIGSARITPAARIRFALLLYCAVERGRRHTRRALTELLWPTSPEEIARHSLRNAIYTLRDLGVPLADGRADDAVSIPADRVTLDYETTLGDTAAGRAVIGELGECLPGYDPRFSPAFGDWVDQLRGCVHRLARDAILRAITRARGESCWSEVERFARLCLRFDPVNEEATLALAEATALTGSKAAAVAILDRYAVEVGRGPRELRVPASVLRARIAERMPAPYGETVGDGCFVGRDETMAALTHRLDATRAGAGAGWLVLGEPGIGKSRVTLELARIAALRGLAAHRVACQRSDVRRPLAAFADMVPGLKGLPGALGCSPRSFEFLDRLTQYAPSATADARAAVASGTGLLDRDAWDAEYLYASVRQALFDLIDAVSEERPLLLIIEDVHYLDRVSAEVARELVERSETRPLLLVLTSRVRPAPESPLSGFVRGLTLHALAPIDAAAAERLFLAFVGDRAPMLQPRQLARFITLADGNPFFLRELATHWLEHAETGQLPSSLATAIGERLDRLGAVTIHVLQSCALLGQHSTLARLERVLMLPKLQLLDALETLDRAGLLSTAGNRAVCKHDLLADAATARLTSSGERFLRRQIGIALESELTPSEQGPLLWDCAQHLQAAGEVDRALRLIERSADQVQAIGLPSEAVAIWDRAKSICATDAQRLAVSEHRVAALMAAEEWAQALDGIADVRALRTALSQHPHRHDAMELAELEARWLLGDDMQQLLNGAETCLRDHTADAGHRIAAGSWALVQAYNLGNPDVVQTIYAAIIDLFASHPPSSEDRDHIDLIYHTGYGDLGRAVNAGRDLVARARAASQPVRLARALRHAAIPLKLQGRMPEATLWLLEALDISERLKLSAGIKAASFLLGEAALGTGDLKAARQWLSKCLSDRTSFSEDINVTVLAGQMAILERDAGECRTLVDRIATLPVQPSSVRVRSNILAIAVGLDLLANTYASSSQKAQDFAALFARARATSGQDFPAFVRCKMLEAEGRSDEARAVLQDYVEHIRRERSTLPYYLQACRNAGDDMVRAA